MIRSTAALAVHRRTVFHRLQREWALASNISSSSTTSDASSLASAIPQQYSTVSETTRIRLFSVYSGTWNHHRVRSSSSSLQLRYFSADPTDNTIDSSDNNGLSHNDVANALDSNDAASSATAAAVASTENETRIESEYAIEGQESIPPPPKKKRNYKRRFQSHRLVDKQMRRIQKLQIEPKLHRQHNVDKDFLYLAKRMEWTQMKWMEKLYKEIQKELKTIKGELQGKKKLRQYKVKGLEEEVDPQRRLWRKALEFFAMKKVPKEMKDVFLQRLVVNVQKIHQEEQVSAEEQQRIEEDVALLQRARMVAVEHPMFWSREWKRKLRKVLKKHKLAEKLLEEAATPVNSNDRLATLSELYATNIRRPVLQTQHDQLTEKQRYAEAKDFQAKMHLRLPEQQYRGLMQYLRDYVDNCEVIDGLITKTGDSIIDDEDELLAVDSNVEIMVDEDDIEIPSPIVIDSAPSNDTAEPALSQQQLHTQQELRILKSNLLQFIPDSRMNFVTKDVADFLYVTATDELVDSTLGATELITIVVEDRLVKTSQTKWDAAQELYSKCFMQIHKMLLKAKEELPPIIEGAATEIDDTEASIFETFEEIAATKPTKEEAVLANTQRVKPRRYINFEAMEIGQPIPKNDGEDETTSGTFDLAGAIHLTSENALRAFESDVFPAKAPTDRMVFIDNLPIDIQKDRLLNAYGRIGEIEALELCHYRPELDPGRKAIDDRKKIRSPSSSSRRQRWQRPRTPLYGMILYKEAEAATKAVADPLRIFGMVLDKHLIRSHRATDMTKLYLEDVHPKHDITAIEYELSRILHPDLYVCLDVSANRRRQRGKLMSLSCVIQLPSFEASYWAYQKLHMELEFLREEDSECALHWIETPADAMLYWTRQLNF